jgi:hypothetical protein
MPIEGKGGRPLGHPKTGGRQKGTPNRATQDVAEKIAALGCDPIEGLAKIAMDGKNSAELRARCYMDLAQYVHPKRKPVDVAMQPPTEMNVITNIESAPSEPDVGNLRNTQP